MRLRRAGGGFRANKGGLAMRVKLTAEQDARWVQLFAIAINSGWSEHKADSDA